MIAAIQEELTIRGKRTFVTLGDELNSENWHTLAQSWREWEVNPTIARIRPETPFWKGCLSVCSNDFLWILPRFIIVATCVITFEARDSAGKARPGAFGTSESSSSHVYPLTNKNRREVRSVPSPTPGSSLSGSSIQSFDINYLMDALSM